MHIVVFYVSIVWAVLLVAATALLVIRAETLLVRILALDSLTLELITLLILFTDLQRVPYYLDAALALALVAFVGTLGAVWYYRKGGLFS